MNMWISKIEFETGNTSSEALSKSIKQIKKWVESEAASKVLEAEVIDHTEFNRILKVRTTTNIYYYKLVISAIKEYIENPNYDPNNFFTLKIVPSKEHIYQAKIEKLNKNAYSYNPDKTRRIRIERS